MPNEVPDEKEPLPAASNEKNQRLIDLLQGAWAPENISRIHWQVDEERWVMWK